MNEKEKLTVIEIDQTKEDIKKYRLYSKLGLTGTALSYILGVRAFMMPFGESSDAFSAVVAGSVVSTLLGAGLLYVGSNCLVDTLELMKEKNQLEEKLDKLYASQSENTQENLDIIEKPKAKVYQK